VFCFVEKNIPRFDDVVNFSDSIGQSLEREMSY